MTDSGFVITPASFTSFGELLRYLRRRAELSQRELALHVGYHYSYMSRIENNEHVPDPAMLMARFVPALSLEKEPAWTRRLLELAAAGEKGAGSAAARPAPVEAAAAEPAPLPDDLLPVSLTPLLGRHEDVSALLASFDRREVRLITLIGPPGVGKTRLAVQTASEAAGMFAHGVKFIDLAPATEAGAFLPVLAQHLDVNEIPDVPLLTRLAQALRQKNLLLVLDNFEQLIDAAPQVYQLLSNTQDIKMLVTSRIPLHVAGENQFIVRPLALPQTTSGKPGEDLLGFSAVRLFVDRARAVQPDFRLTAENTRAVVEICRRLDGLPLAIELAAARVRTLTPPVMLKEFEHRFDWLAPNLRESQSARQTLRGAIEWSYNLLSEKEKVLFRRLSVFSARRTVETVRAVCADQGEMFPTAPLFEHEIFDLLIRLTDQSLLYTDTHLDETRFIFLETIHEYAREKLNQASEETACKNRHLAYFCQIAEQVEIEVEFENQTAWLNRCEAELNNMRAALDWSLKPGGDLQTGLRLAASLGLFWYLHSHFIEGLERCKLFLEKARASGDARLLAKLLYRTADLHLHQAEFDAAVALSSEAVALCRQIDDKAQLAWALYVQGDIRLALQDLEAAEQSLDESIRICIEIGYAAVQDIALLLLSSILLSQGELERAREAVLEGLALAERLSDPWGIAAGLRTLGAIRMNQKDYAGALECLERSLEASRTVGDKIIIGSALVNLAALTNIQGQPDESDRYAEEALDIFQRIGDETQQPYPLRLMGYASIQAGNLVRARVLLRAGLAGSAGLQDLRGQLAGLAGLAQCALAEGDLGNAARLFAAVQKVRLEKALKLAEPDEIVCEEVQTRCEAALGTAGFEALVFGEPAQSLEEIIRQELAVA